MIFAAPPRSFGLDPHRRVRRGANRIEHVEHRARRATVERALQRADRRDDGRDQIRSRGCDDARREGRRGVHPVISDRDEVSVERAGARRVGGLPRRHPKDVSRMAERGIGRDGLPTCARACPRRRERADRADDRCRRTESVGFGEMRDRGAQRVHSVVAMERISEARDPFERAKSPRSDRRADRRCVFFEEQRRQRLERDGAGEILHVVTGDDQVPPLTVDVAEPRLRHHHALEPARRCRLLRTHCAPPVPVIWGRDPRFPSWIRESISSGLRERRGSRRPPRREARDALRLRQPAASSGACLRGAVARDATHARISERLEARRDARLGHGPFAAGALRWGETVLASELTAIAGDDLHYR